MWSFCGGLMIIFHWVKGNVSEDRQTDRRLAHYYVHSIFQYFPYSISFHGFIPFYSLQNFLYICKSVQNIWHEILESQDVQFVIILVRTAFNQGRLNKKVCILMNPLLPILSISLKVSQYLVLCKALRVRWLHECLSFHLKKNK